MKLVWQSIGLILICLLHACQQVSNISKPLASISPSPNPVAVKPSAIIALPSSEFIKATQQPEANNTNCSDAVYQKIKHLKSLPEKLQGTKMRI